MTNHSGQQLVIPFYVCEVKQPILSDTRLVEQGFQLTLDDNPRLQRAKGFNSALENRNGPRRNHNVADTGYAGDWLLAVQHTRRTCESKQAIQEDTFHSVKNTVSSPIRATRGLQENNHQIQGWRNKYV